MTALGGASVAHATRSADVIVNMQDACDPASFNAAIGAGACVRSGGVKFDGYQCCIHPWMRLDAYVSESHPIR